MRQFFCRVLQMLSTVATIEVGVVYLQCSVPCHVNLLARKVFENICIPFFRHKLTSISRQSWSCEEIPSSQNRDKETKRPRFERMKVNYSKSLRNKITLLKRHEVFSYLQNHQLWDILDFRKCSYSETWQNTQFTTAILFSFIFTA